MNFSKTWFFGAIIAASLGVSCARVEAQGGRLTVGINQPGIKISPLLYGLMTEEINFSFDGGLYAELIRNRVFKDHATQIPHWSLRQESGGAGAIALDNTQPLNAALPTSLKLSITSAGRGVGVANEGYWGIPVKPRTTYRASFYAKAARGFKGPLSVTIQSNDGTRIHARATVSKISTVWRKYSVLLKTGRVAPSTTNRFVISARQPGSVWLNLVSLMPPTYRNRPNGNRIDLMEALNALKPAFLRFPGGNYLEGNTIAERFDWKKTLGPLEARPGHQGPWNGRSSDGMGLLEFMHWCEDGRMEPVLGVFAGYALNGEYIAAGPRLQPFVQDALDEIEYLTGDIGTKWGAIRAANGHAAPFRLRYVEIGNEDWFDRSGSYDGRYTQFHDAIKAKYPHLQLIATTAVQSRKPDLIDDHFYASASQMARDSHRYDKADRNGPKILVGEWASQDVGEPWQSPDSKGPTPSLNAALGDAAWMIGMERNSDIVVMQCYAPLLVNVNAGARQWAVNLIGYDALRSFGSPSYYAQKMFANNRGDIVLPVAFTASEAASTPEWVPRGGIGVGTWRTRAEFKDIKVTQGDKVLYQPNLSRIADWKLDAGQWKAQNGVLSQSSLSEDQRATIGNANWTDYSYSLKARKIAGEEGFLVLFHVANGNDLVWLNVGGWGNKDSALERFDADGKREISRRAPFVVETGRWYDIRIEVKGRDIRCFIDNQLIAQATDEPALPTEAIHATASRDANGDVILKVVNMSSVPQPMLIELQGAKGVNKEAIAQVMSGEPTDINTLQTPLKVAPRTLRFPVSGPNFRHEFPAYSVNVLRFKTK